jgi:glycosyltransferase involved in cell wall biosynthesis
VNAPATESLNSPTLGVVIINYNYARYVASAIDSVLAQTRAFDQVIVVDDGSTDDSLSVLRRYQGQALIVEKPNGGQLTATLAGLAACRTEYVYILDADDFAEPRFVEEIAPRLADRPIKVQCQLRGVDARGEPLMSLFPVYPKVYDASRMRQDNESIGFYICPPTAGNVYRRDYLDSIDLARLPPNEPLDGPPALAAPYFGEVATVRRPLACYRVHGSNDSRWDRPDARLLQGEIDWFERRWRQVGEMLGRERPPFGDDQPLYVRERRLMLAALDRGESLASLAAGFIARLWRTHTAPKHRLLLTAWAVSLLAPSRGFRRWAVYARRSPVNRSSLVKRLIVGNDAKRSVAG